MVNQLLSIPFGGWPQVLLLIPWETKVTLWSPTTSHKTNWWWFAQLMHSDSSFKCPPFLEIGWKLDWFTLTHRDGQCLQFLQLTLLISCNSSLAALFEPLFEDISCPASITVNIRSLIECQKIRNLVEKKTMLWNTRIVLGVVAFSDRPEPQKMEMWVNGKTSNTLGRSFSRCSQFAGNTEIQTKGESSSSSCCQITALACSVIENSDGGQWGGGRTL